jgi:diacylglycerol kinase
MIRPDPPTSHNLESANLRGPGFEVPIKSWPSAVEDGTPAELLPDFDPTPVWTPRAGRRNLREKLIAGLVGAKHAFRGDSSFFAHAYRALLVFLIAGMIGVPPFGWCMLVFALGLVLIAEFTHSAVDTLARAIGDPEEPRLKMARDIAAAGVLVAVVISAAISITVLTIKLGDFLGWWDRVILESR